MRRVYLFTATYPYGQAESFIETEIVFLADKFDSVIIIPFSGKGEKTRMVPSNCNVFAPIISGRLQHYLGGLFCFRTLSLFVKDFFSQKVYANRQRLKAFFIAYATANKILLSKSIRELLKNTTTNDVLYFYWGKGSSFIAPFISDIKAKKIVRFHGEWDLWEESSGNYAPIRNYITGSIDLAVFISSKGEQYFKNRYSNCKTIVNKLGTKDIGVARQSSDGIFRLLSCSTLTPLKRVSLIFETLQLIDEIPIEWTHIGDGPNYHELLQLSKNTRHNVKIKLVGAISNQDVLKYYSENYVDAFINVSSNEGIPVSLMEAISFNVPIIATNVGGTSEIVNNETGILLTADPRPVEIKKAILKIKKTHLNPKVFWRTTYNAEQNYNEFSNIILNL